jgi:regulatory protein
LVDHGHAPGNLRYAGPMSKSGPPQPIRKADLEKAALRYLARFAATVDSLRRVLLRRVERAGGDPAQGAVLVADLIARYQAAGILDDRRYAEAKSRSLMGRGRSLRGVRQYLAGRGVDGEVIDDALAGLAVEADGAGPDAAAALAYARRRRLGPFRPPASRHEHRLRDLAALGRAGFSWEIARAIIDGEDK